MNNQLTLSQLESYLWEAANILRGSPVDRTDWKSYILPLLFFKRNGFVREEQGEYETQNLKQLWQTWEQDGRQFWQEMDELIKMLGGLKG